MTPAGVLACTGSPDGAGAGLFNSARLTSLGAVSVASACAPVDPLVVVHKQWVIDGQTYADGSQPDGFSAALTLDGAPAAWDAVHPAAAGQAVQVGEQATVPSGCANIPDGLGPLSTSTAVTDHTVTNHVTCAELPATGWSGQPIALVAAILSFAGLLLLTTRRRRRPGRVNAA